MEWLNWEKLKKSKNSAANIENSISKSTSNKYYKLIKAIFYIAMFVPILTMKLGFDSDIWFLLNHGRYILNNGFPTTEPFTIHTDLNFIMQQWLSSVIYYLAYQVGSSAAVLAITAIVYILTVFMMYKLSMLVSDNNYPISVILTTIFSFVICFFVVTRPIIFSMLILLCNFYCIEKYLRTNYSIKPLIFLVINSLLLINLHASMWWLEFILLLPYIVDSFKFKFMVFEGEGYKKSCLFITLILMFLVGFINPYGYKNIIYIFLSYGNSIINETIAEMQPFKFSSMIGITFYTILIIIPIIYIMYNKGTVKLRYLLLTAGTSLLALMAHRNGYVFYISVFFPIAYYMKDFPDYLEKYSSYLNKSISVVLSVMMAIILTILSVIAVYDVFKDNPLPDTYEAYEYLLETNVDLDKMVAYTGYNDGAYLEFLGIKCYIDARAEVFLKSLNGESDIFEEYYLLQKGQINYKKFIDKYEFTHLFVRETDALNTYLEDDTNFRLLYWCGDIYVYQNLNLE